MDVASSEFLIDGKEQTDSRVTLLTGVHRKEVRRLREEGAEDASIPPELSRTSQLGASGEKTDASAPAVVTGQVSASGALVLVLVLLARSMNAGKGRLLRIISFANGRIRRAIWACSSLAFGGVRGADVMRDHYSHTSGNQRS